MSENFDEVERKPKSGRRLVRDELFKIIFEVEADENSKERIKVIYDQYIVRDEELRPKLNGEELAFIEKYINGMQEKNEKIEKIISENMENWSLDRIGLVERTLLKISVYELLEEDVPTEISVNEAVELAKEYGDTKAYEFVNGVLAKVIKAEK